MPDFENITLEQALREKLELEKDLIALLASYKIMAERIVALPDKERMHPLEDWPGAHAIMGSMQLAINAAKGTIKDYEQLLVQATLGQQTGVTDDRPS